MGANIKVIGNDFCDKGNVIPIWFYAHWGDQELAVVLQSALKRGQGRWSDCSYLNRIIFSEMIQGNVLGDAGFGISLDMPDNEYNIIEVYHHSKLVKIDDKQWTFSDYIYESPDVLKKAMRSDY